MAQRMINQEEQGHSVFFFTPRIHPDDYCVMDQTEPYSDYRLILGIGIILTQILNVILIPFFSHGFSETIIDKLHGDNSVKTAKHYFYGFTSTIFCIGILVYASDLHLTITVVKEAIKQSVFGDVLMYYYAGLGCLVLFPLLLNLVTTTLLLMKANPLGLKVKITEREVEWRTFKSGFCKFLFLGPTVFAFVFVAELFTFHLVYMGIGFFAAPIETCSLLFLYLTMVFLITMSVALTTISIEYVCTNRLHQARRKWSICGYVTTVIICILIFLVSMVFYLLFYYLMVIAVAPYSSQGILLAAVGSLIPSIFNISTGILQKQVIRFLSRQLLEPGPAERNQPPPQVPGDEPPPLVPGDEPPPLVPEDEPPPLVPGDEPPPLVPGDESHPLVTGDEPPPLVTGDESHPPASGNQSRPAAPRHHPSMSNTPDSSATDKTPLLQYKKSKKYQSTVTVKA